MSNISEIELIRRRINILLLTNSKDDILRIFGIEKILQKITFLTYGNQDKEFSIPWNTLFSDTIVNEENIDGIIIPNIYIHDCNLIIFPVNQFSEFEIKSFLLNTDLKFINAVSVFEFFPFGEEDNKIKYNIMREFCIANAIPFTIFLVAGYHYGLSTDVDNEKIEIKEKELAYKLNNWNCHSFFHKIKENELVEALKYTDTINSTIERIKNNLQKSKDNLNNEILKYYCEFLHLSINANELDSNKAAASILKSIKNTIFNSAEDEIPAIKYANNDSNFLNKLSLKIDELVRKNKTFNQRINALQEDLPFILKDILIAYINQLKLYLNEK